MNLGPPPVTISGTPAQRARFAALMRPPQDHETAYRRVKNILGIDASPPVRVCLYDDQAMLDVMLSVGRKGAPGLYLHSLGEIWLCLPAFRPGILTHEYAHLLLRHARPMSPEAEEVLAQWVEAEFI